jgi:hypothetical protein
VQASLCSAGVCSAHRSVGTAARVGIRTANLMRPMDVLYSGRGLPTLPGLTNVSTDMPAIKDQLDR